MVTGRGSLLNAFWILPIRIKLYFETDQRDQINRTNNSNEHQPHI
jgi:hypothetical protein